MQRSFRRQRDVARVRRAVNETRGTEFQCRGIRAMVETGAQDSCCGANAGGAVAYVVTYDRAAQHAGEDDMRGAGNSASGVIDAEEIAVAVEYRRW